MAIRKQEFYEGAALHLLARSGRVSKVRYEPPFFYFNDQTAALLKYTTKNRSPWAFTFTSAEQLLLRDSAAILKTEVALICGADGVAAISYADFVSIAAPRAAAVHISCYRQHGEHYEVNGPDGTFRRKIAPSRWCGILGN